MRRFIVAAAIVVSLMGGVLGLGHLVAGESASFLPPYFTKKELKKMARSARARKRLPHPPARGEENEYGVAHV